MSVLPPEPGEQILTLEGGPLTWSCIVLVDAGRTSLPYTMLYLS